MKLQTYNDISIIAIRHTINPGYIAKIACDMTMQTTVDYDNEDEASDRLLKFLITAEHTSVLEHCSITFKVEGVSRSLLAQLSRHRHASLTSQSQHYQDYRTAPAVVSPSMIEGATQSDFDSVMSMYSSMRDAGIAPEEARQILPNAAAVNLLWTVNARGLLSFLRPRLCWRNVEEMAIFAKKTHAASMLWWPELFQHVGPPCLLGPCNQGPMAKGCPHLATGGFKHDD